MTSQDRLPEAAAVTETHISVLFFVGDRVYKLKKPVTFGFVDFSKRERRGEACRQEVELNRRLAPDVYLGVFDVTEQDGSPVDHLVVMRRMPADRQLSRLVRSSSRHVIPCLAGVARQLAEFHEAASQSPVIDRAATHGAIARVSLDNFKTMQQYRDVVLDGAVLDECRYLTEAFVSGRAPLFEKRLQQGCICDGHGDLQADDIFYLDDGPRILDCLEFDDTLRYGDVANDVAFLAMDLERLSDPASARAFIRLYEQASGTQIPPALLHFYIAYRAAVRAKVSCLRWGQSDPGSRAAHESAKSAQALLGICRDHLRRATVALVLVGGNPGTGKSTLARELGRRLGVPVLRSDELRHELFPRSQPDNANADNGFEQGRYSPLATAAVYRELLERARSALEQGESVILDASWRDGSTRAQAAALARECSAALVELRCEASAPVATARIEARLAAGDHESEATPEIASLIAAAAEPWPTATTILTERPIAACVDDAEEVVRVHGAVPLGSAYARDDASLNGSVTRPSGARPATGIGREATMERVQPADEWKFLPRDDELEGMSDDESPEDQAPEAAAIHVRDPWGLTPAEDPGVADVDLGLDGDDAPPVSYFDDEQPEPGGGTSLVQPDEVEPDLEDLLESQHYAFSPEPPDGN